MAHQWIITGANGYLGGELCKSLRRQQGDVVGIARAGRNLQTLSAMGISCCTYEDLPSRLSLGVVFVHCAGLTGVGGHAEDFLHVNKDWAVRLFELAEAHQVGCFIYFSSVAAMGYRNRAIQAPLDESSLPELANGESYGHSKWLAEQALLTRAATSSTRLVILRPGLIYGHRPVDSAQTWLRRGMLIDPGQRIPLVHVEHIADAVVRVATHPEARGVFLLVDDEQPTVRELNAMKIQLGMMRYAPWPIGKAGFWLFTLGRAVARILRGRGNDGSPRQALAQYSFLTRRLLYCTDKLRARTGWKPTISLREGLAECARHNRLSTTGHG